MLQNFILTLNIYNSAIREAAKWYKGHLAGKTQIVLITNDRENKSKAIREGLSSETSMLFAVVYIVTYFGTPLLSEQLIEEAFWFQLNHM